MTSQSVDQARGVASSPSSSRLLRNAGWASITLATAFVFQFLLLLLFTGNIDPHQNLTDYLAQGRITGLISAVLWIVAGIATIVVTRGVGDEQARRRPDSMVTTTVWFLSYAGGIGLLLAGTIDVAAFGLPGQTLTLIPGHTVGAEWLAYQSAAGIVWTGARLVACIGESAWLVVLATTGRRAGLVGWPIAILALVSAAIILVPPMVFGTLSGQLFVIPMFLTLGIQQLRMSARLKV